MPGFELVNVWHTALDLFAVAWIQDARIGLTNRTAAILVNTVFVRVRTASGSAVIGQRRTSRR